MQSVGFRYVEVKETDTLSIRTGGEAKMGSFRARHLLGAGVCLLAFLVLAQTGAAEAEEGKIESVLERSEAQPWHVSLGRWFGKRGVREGKECEEPYGIFPCSTSLGGNSWLLITYVFMLLKAAQFLSEGSELLLEVMSPGIIGGLVLPILGAFPDALLITASGLGASQEEAQEEVLVGMGLVAGASVLVLTVLWGSCLIAGRCDLVRNRRGQLVAKDKLLTKGFSLTETGVTNDKQTMWASWIMVATLLPYLVAQIPRLFGLNTEGLAFTAVAAVIAVLSLFGYCIYQITAPWIQERRIEFAKQRFRRSHAFHRAYHFTKSQGWGNLFNFDGKPDREVLEKLFHHFDQEKDDHLSAHELKGLLVGLGVERHNGQVPDEEEVQHWMTEFDTSKDRQISFEEFFEGMERWMKSSKSGKVKIDLKASHSGHWDTEAQAARDELAENDEDDDEEVDDEPPSRNQIIAKAVGYLILGAAVAAVFADPLVGAIGGFSKASGISPFFISFIATPLATSSSEAISSLIFAKRKRKKTISMTYSQIYGAVTMRNTLCLGIFLAIVYFRNLVWDFSAEITVIFFVTLIMGVVAAFRTTLQLWMAFIGLALYPLSIALVAFLDYVCGWH